MINTLEEKVVIYDLKDPIPWDVHLILDRLTECKNCGNFAYKVNSRTNKWCCACCGKKVLKNEICS